MLVTAKLLDLFQDMALEDLMKMSDEELIREVMADGEDPKALADRIRNRLVDARLLKAAHCGGLGVELEGE